MEGGPWPVSPGPGPGLALWFRQSPEVCEPQALLSEPPAAPSGALQEASDCAASIPPGREQRAGGNVG